MPGKASILSWASRFDDASCEAKHLVIAQLVDWIEIRRNDGYDITIHWRMLSWVDYYAKANVETKHMIISRIIERVEIKARNKIHIKFKISLDQFLGKEA